MGKGCGQVSTMPSKMPLKVGQGWGIRGMLLRSSSSQPTAFHSSTPISISRQSETRYEWQEVNPVVLCMTRSTVKNYCTQSTLQTTTHKPFPKRRDNDTSISYTHPKTHSVISHWSQPTWNSRSTSERRVIIKSVDMSGYMQDDVIDCASEALDKYKSEKEIAKFIKTEFEKKYKPTWHCIVGRNFGSFVTHETRHFIYFYLGKVYLCLKFGPEILYSQVYFSGQLGKESYCVDSELVFCDE
ncbi:unnamed protein product [Choristocarpus tenellus]